MTPFTADGAVDHESLANLVEWQLASGTHGVSIGGSTGEPGAQSIDERLAAIRHGHARPSPTGCRSSSAPAPPSCTRPSSSPAAAVELGIDASLIITPYYARPTQEALYVWYKTVAAEFPDLPIIAYNVPSRTAVDIAPETVARLYPRRRELRRGQGDDQGLRALLAASSSCAAAS